MPESTAKSLSTRLTAVAAAVAAGLAVMGVGAVLVGYLELARLRGVNDRTAELLSWNNSDAMSTLRQAAASIKPGCEDESLYALRKMIMSNRFIAQYGVFSDAGELLCSTTVGVLPQPILITQPDVDVLDGSDLFRYNFNLPLKSGNVGAVTTTVRLGPFSAVTNPVEMQGIYASGVDRILFAGSDGKTIELFASRAARDTSPLFGAALPGSSEWRLDGASLVVSTRAALAPFVVQSISSPATASRAYQLVVVCMSVLAAVFALLTHAAVLPALANRRSLGNRLARLLVPDNVLCVYQPIVDLRTREICGCEVLMRLRVDGQVIYPDQLIELALARGLTQAFDEAVMARVGSELVSLDLPAGFKLSVNFFPSSFAAGAARQLLERNFRGLLDRGVRVCVEVIEQHATSNVMAEVAALKRDGFEISIDDFGTGFSNLGAVRKLAPNFLKIDRSFVHDMEDGAVRSSLIPEIIAIARAVQASVIAEGIENHVQAERLAELGAEYGQGYLFARPMPLVEFSARLAERRTQLGA